MLVSKHPAERSRQLAAGTGGEFLEEAFRRLDVMGALATWRSPTTVRSHISPGVGISGSDGRA